MANVINWWKTGLTLVNHVSKVFQGQNFIELSNWQSRLPIFWSGARSVSRTTTKIQVPSAENELVNENPWGCKAEMSRHTRDITRHFWRHIKKTSRNYATIRRHLRDIVACKNKNCVKSVQSLDKENRGDMIKT